MADSNANPIAVRPRPATLEDGVLPARRECVDQAAFARLVADHQARVAGLAHRLLGWQGDVEDIVQDVFLAAFKHLDSFRGEASVATWLMRITVNQCRTRRRRHALRLRTARHAHATGECESASPDRDRMSAESSERVREAVRALPRRYREVIVLRYLQEMPIAEVAAVVGRSRSAVEVRLSRARDRLRKRIGPLLEENFRGS